MLLGVAVRHRRGVLVALVAVLGASQGCAGRSSTSEDPEAHNTPAEAGDQQALTIDRTRCDGEGKRSDHEDLNHDGRADLIALYAGDGSEGALACKQADLNFDGRLDAYFHYDGEGALEREQFDLDFDGRIDTGRYYRNGEVILDEQDTNQDGYVDTWRRYEKGQLVRMETDRDADGKADMLTYFVGGRIDRIGYDINGDGRVDQWDHDAARRARLAAQHRRPDEPEAPAESVEYIDEPADASPDAASKSESPTSEDPGKGKPAAKDEDRSKSTSPAQKTPTRDAGDTATPPAKPAPRRKAREEGHR